MPLLLRLREAWVPGLAVRCAGARVRRLVVEMYTRLNTGPVHKSNAAARAAYLERKRVEDAAYQALGRTVAGRAALAAALAGEDAFDCAGELQWSWRRAREGFYRLPRPQDPKARLEGWTWAADAAGACST